MCFNIIKPSVKYIREEKKKYLFFKPPNVLPSERIPLMEKKKNLWTDNEIEIVTLEDLKDAMAVDACSFFYNTREKKELSQEARLRIKEAIELVKDRYTLRLSGDTEDKVFNYISLIATNKEIYLPFKKYNPTVSEPRSAGGNPRAFGVVKGLHKNYDKLPGIVRALNARDVEMVYGASLLEKVKLILIYSECGTEAMNKNVNFFQLGSLVLPLRIATAGKIPLINLGASDSLSKLKHFLSKSTPSSETPKLEETDGLDF